MKIYTKAVLIGVPLAVISAAVIILFSINAVRRFMIRELVENVTLDAREKSELFSEAFMGNKKDDLLTAVQRLRENAEAVSVAAISPKREVLAHTDVSEIGKIYQDPFTLQAFQNEKIGAAPEVLRNPPSVRIGVPIRSRAPVSFGEEFLFVDKDGPTIGYLQITVPLARLLVTENRISENIFWIVVLAFGIVMGLVLILLSQALRPIHLLARAARRIGQGHFGELVAVGSKDEVGELARTFNQMSEILAKTTVSKDELQRSEQLLSAIISSLTEAIFIVDSTTRRIVTCNAAAEEIFGYKSAELLGQPIRMLHLNDGAADYFEGKGFVSPRAGKFVEMEYQLRRKSGEAFPVETFIKPIAQGNGIIEHHVFVVRDISERKKAEEERTRLSQLVEQAVESVVITDTEGKIIYVNHAFEEVSGYKREEVLGKNPRILKSGKQDPAFYSEMWGTISKGQTWRGRLINQRKDGTLFEEEAILSPVRDTSGAIVSFAALKRDITKQMEMEQQLLQSQKMEAIGRLAGGVAHDFNNLLTSILGFAQIVLEQAGPQSPMAEDIQEIIRAGERAAALTQQLLAFSRRQVIEPKTLDVGTVVAEMEKMLKRLIGEDIDLRIKNDPGAWQVKIDPNQFGQVLINLAVNARDAMPKGGMLSIDVKNERVEEKLAYRHEQIAPGEYVVVSVSDTGSGMPEDVQRHLFEPFFTTKPKGKGTGLGLATLYGVVKQNKGAVTVYSEVGKGTAFRIYLPRYAEAGKPRESVVEVAEVLSGKETILLVEDEKMVRTMAERGLGNRGYKILACGTGQEALAVMDKMREPIHLLLTDVVMPEMSGPDLAKKVEEKRPGIKVLFMSGYTDEMMAAHGILEEGTHFIQKPFTPSTLAKKVREVLG